MEINMKSDELQEELKDSHPIMLSEAKYLLEAHKERFKADFRSNASKLFRTTFTYLDEFCRIKDRSIVEDLRNTLSGLGFDELEIALLGTLFPQSVDEAKVLIPSLKEKNEDKITQAVEKIQQVI